MNRSAPRRAPRREPAIRLPALCLAAMAGSLTGGCGTPCEKCDVTEAEASAGTPKVASLETGLEGVQVTKAPGINPERRFQLSAWYRDADGNIVSGRFPAMHWSFAPTGEGSADDFGKVTVTAFPGLGTATARAQKSDDATIADEVTVTRWADATGATSAGDVVIEGSHVAGEPPNVVLLEESAAGKC